jgi:hypothetical protein
MALKKSENFIFEIVEIEDLNFKTSKSKPPQGAPRSSLQHALVLKMKFYMSEPQDIRNSPPQACVKVQPF